MHLLIEKQFIPKEERDLLDKIISNYINNKTSDFITQEANKSWVPLIKLRNPNFNQQNLRQDFTRNIDGFTFEMVNEAAEFFLMSPPELSDYSCLSREGINKNKVLNHALNAHTSLVSIKQDDSKIARALISIIDRGDINVYPVYRYDDSFNTKELEQGLKKYAEEYKNFMGITKSSNLERIPESTFNMPSYYDQPIHIL